MQTKVVLKSISPVGAPLPQAQGQPPGPPQYTAYTATFVAQDFPADSKVPDDYVHLPALAPVPVVVSAEQGKALRVGGEYVVTIQSVGT